MNYNYFDYFVVGSYHFLDCLKTVLVDIRYKALEAAVNGFPQEAYNIHRIYKSLLKGLVS